MRWPLASLSQRDSVEGALQHAQQLPPEARMQLLGCTVCAAVACCGCLGRQLHAPYLCTARQLGVDQLTSRPERCTAAAAQSVTVQSMA